MLYLENMERRVAIFDVDGTIFRSSLLIELVRSLIENGLFPKSALQDFSLEEERWLNRKGDYDSYILAVVKVFMKHIKGVSYKEFMETTEDMLLREQDHVYRYTRDLVVSLKKDGDYLLAISQSPKSVVDSFCKRLGFDKIYGRIYELGPQNKMTGNIVDLHLIENKANILKRAVKKEGLTLSDSVGVGDTESDIHFLELIDKPICFNPNKLLYRHAKLNSWEVIVERKDVIYTIPTKD